MRDLIAIIKIANRLDQHGATKEADLLDAIIKKLASARTGLSMEEDDEEAWREAFRRFKSMEEEEPSDEDLSAIEEEPSEEELSAMEMVQEIDELCADLQDHLAENIVEPKALYQGLKDFKKVLSHLGMEAALDLSQASSKEELMDLMIDFISGECNIMAKELYESTPPQPVLLQAKESLQNLISFLAAHSQIELSRPAWSSGFQIGESSPKMLPTAEASRKSK